MTAYETIIGLEVHAQVLTASKMFCGCSADYTAAAPNTHVCPVCMALPGSLPVINRTAVEKTIMAGLALNCTMAEHAVFARKNYHYADLPKGYQISQYELPFCRDGWLEIVTDAGQKRIGITRAHLEEDTGKLVHAAEGGRLVGSDGGSSVTTLVDLNRAGVPLLEIVTEPDLRSPDEAYTYLTDLQRILRYLGVSTADMEKGAMRCEANVSVRPVEQSAFGTKVEVKNLNSFRSVKLALEYEVKRQIDALERGEKVVQVTMGWDEEVGRTVLQRSKESSDDYRYFPEPDLPPLEVSHEWVDELKRRMPELPEAKRGRFVAELSLDAKDAAVLAENRAVAEYFEATVDALRGAPSGPSRQEGAKAAANWITGELFRLMKANATEIEALRVQPEGLAELIALVEGNQVNQNSAKRVLGEMFQSGRGAREVLDALGLGQVSNADELATIVAKVIESNEDQVLKYRSGKESVFNWLLGQVMRETRGKGNPALVRELLLAALREPAAKE
ncbi:MAG: Asp-tRNA(Asn)/Glu-tRNA(Gln) amidotransferase subunit GatB [Nitrososphaerales archaeon]